MLLVKISSYIYDLLLNGREMNLGMVTKTVVEPGRGTFLASNNQKI